MVCAYMKHLAEGVLVRIENMALRARIAMRTLLLAGMLLSCLPGSNCCPAEATQVRIISGMLRSAPI